MDKDFFVTGIWRVEVFFRGYFVGPKSGYFVVSRFFSRGCFVDPKFFLVGLL